MPKRKSKWKVGDLLTDREWPGEGFGVIVQILDLRLKDPYLVSCNHGDVWLSKKTVEEECVKVA